MRIEGVVGCCKVGFRDKHNVGQGCCRVGFRDKHNVGQGCCRVGFGDKHHEGWILFPQTHCISGSLSFLV